MREPRGFLRARAAGGGSVHLMYFLVANEASVDGDVGLLRRVQKAGRCLTYRD
jgi:hypothetical protein